MEKRDIEIGWVVCIVAFCIAVTVFAVSRLESENSIVNETANIRWDDCVKSVNKEIPDANDTESRSKLYKICYEVTYPK